MRTTRAMRPELERSEKNEMFEVDGKKKVGRSVFTIERRGYVLICNDFK